MRRAAPAHRGADLEEVIGEGLVEYAGQDASPAALALLSGIACLGTPRQAALAEKAGLALIERGVARPAWSEHVGAVAAAECYVNSDIFGDCDEAVCLFSYAGTDPHALVMVVDYNAGGLLRDGWVTSKVDTLLERCRPPAGAPPDRPVRGAFRRVSTAQARRLLEAALTATDAATDPPVSESFPAYHAFIRARIRTLCPAEPARRAGQLPVRRARHRAGQPRRCAGLAGGGGAAAGLERRPPRHAGGGVPRLRRGRGPVGPQGGQPVRGSHHRLRLQPGFRAPAADEPGQSRDLHAGLAAAQDHALAAGAACHAARARRLGALGRAAPRAPPEAIEETLDAVFNSMATFARVYHDPATFGLDPQIVARLLPDADLEALPRRAFAFPLLQGRYGGVDLSTLDPSQPQARRTLVAADHDDAHGRPTSEQHIGRHLVLSDRLWRGDPPELWEAAQRLLDRGENRHAVQHTLMYLIRDAGGDCAKLIAELGNLP